MSFMARGGQQLDPDELRAIPEALDDDTEALRLAIFACCGATEKVMQLSAVERFRLAMRVVQWAEAAGVEVDL